MDIILNETPIRTAKNYAINNIKLENIEIPENVKQFDGLDFSGDVDKFEILEINKFSEFKYGNGKILEDQIKEKSNKTISINAVENKTRELQLNYEFSEENKDLIENLEINLKDRSSSTVILKYKSVDESKDYHNSKIKVIANKEARANIIIVNILNNNSNNFIAIENILEENADVKYTIIDFGGKNSITNYYANLKGDNSTNTLNTIYLGNEEQVIDLNYIMECYGKKTNANMDVKGAIDNKCKKHFKGTIDFKKGCKKTIGDEKEYCTILSNTAKSISLPVLLCTEEDVEGSHSSACGKIDKDELFYLMTRGLTKAEAQKLIIKAGFNEIIENIENEEIKKEIVEQIDTKLT